MDTLFTQGLPVGKPRSWVWRKLHKALRNQLPSLLGIPNYVLSFKGMSRRLLIGPQVNLWFGWC